MSEPTETELWQEWKTLTRGLSTWSVAKAMSAATPGTDYGGCTKLYLADVWASDGDIGRRWTPDRRATFRAAIAKVRKDHVPAAVARKNREKAKDEAKRKQAAEVAQQEQAVALATELRALGYPSASASFVNVCLGNNDMRRLINNLNAADDECDRLHLDR